MCNEPCSPESNSRRDLWTLRLYRHALGSTSPVPAARDSPCRCLRGLATACSARQAETGCLDLQCLDPTINISQVSSSSAPERRQRPHPHPVARTSRAWGCSACGSLLTETSRADRGSITTQAAACPCPPSWERQQSTPHRNFSPGPAEPWAARPAAHGQHSPARLREAVKK